MLPITFHVHELNLTVTPKLKQISPNEWKTIETDLELEIKKLGDEIEIAVTDVKGSLHRDVYYGDTLVLKDISAGSKKSVRTLIFQSKSPSKLTQPPPPLIQGDTKSKERPNILSDKKKICYITSNSCVGGVEKLTITLLKHITDYHKTIIVTEIKGAFHSEYEKYSDVCFYEDQKEKLKAFLESNHFDVYHIFNSMIALDLLNKMNGRVIMSMFGDYTNPAMWFKMRRDAFIKNVEYIDVITTDNKKNIDILGNFPIQVNNGIEIPKIAIRKCSAKPIVAWVGRNSGEKRPEVVYTTAKACEDIWFLVAIGNVYDNIAKTKILDMLQRLPNVIMWINANEKQIDFILTHASIILNTSLMEGMPVALLEGMARGCYPIVPNVGTLADLVADVGTVVDDLTIQDYSKYIHEALIKCERDQGLANKIRDRVVKKYDIQNFIDTLKRIYNGDINADKTEILNIANKIEIKNCNERLDAFMKDEPWQIESNMDYARKLYRALFDVDLESVPYWMNAINKGHRRKRFTNEMFYVAKVINKESGTHITDIQNILIKNLKGYEDDNRGGR